MDSFNKFQEGLPDKDHFYNDLKEDDISQEDYDHVTRLWAVFGLNNLGELHDIYVITDTLLLADAFEKHRKLCYLHFGLDPLHYYTLPGFSYDACMKYSGVKLEYIKDVDKLQMIERGIRGGISIISKRLLEPNNKYLPTYDPTKESTYALYIDMNK